jgi:hypothetical protein
MEHSQSTRATKGAYHARLERFKNKTEIKVAHPPPAGIAAVGCARRSRYGRAILQAGL